MKGLKNQWLARDQADPDAGYSITLWESEADIQSARALISGLPRALGVPVEVVQKAVDDTARQLLEADEAAWRASFKPHAIILTDRKIPQPIFVAAMIGVDELLRIDF